MRGGAGWEGWVGMASLSMAILQPLKNSIMKIISQLVLFSLGFAGYNVETMYREYSEVRFTLHQNNFVEETKTRFVQQTPVISIGDTTGPLDEVYFPSVTVCNLNQVEYLSNLCNI